MLFHDLQVSRDPKLAYTKFDKGCSLNNDMCCFYLSGMYISGVENVLEKNMLKAFDFSEKACHLGNVYACANLSQMYRKVSSLFSVCCIYNFYLQET